jgi:hypothetical protein
MWKLQGAEPLIQGGRFINIVADGTEVRIDLQTGRIVESGGDLIVSVKHDQQARNIAPKVPYNWKATITAVNGGIVEAANQRINNMLLAPEDGYLPLLLIDMPGTRPDWSPSVTKNIYTMTRQKLYSRVEINLQCSPTQSTSGVQVNWWLNPSGSRNLEYDPAKRIDPK